MASEFFQGVVWACFLLGTWSFVIQPNIKPSTVLKFLQIFIDIIQKSKKSIHFKKEGHLLKMEGINDNLYLPTFSSNHLYDIICYQDFDHRIKIPITFFQHKDDYVYIPFKPKDFSLAKVFVRIKYVKNDSYIDFEIEENNFIDIPSLIEEYQKKLLQQPEEILAEAYD